MSTGADPKTMPVSPEYDEGYSRTFGHDGSKERGRWVWDSRQGRLVPEAEYTPPEPERSGITLLPEEGLVYDGARATDGADISTRKKHREYMRLNDLTTVDDFRETWSKSRANREKVRSGQGVGDNAARKEAIRRAIYQLEQRARKEKK